MNDRCGLLVCSTMGCQGYEGCPRLNALSLPSSEVRVFDPDAIGEGMRRDLPGTLRRLADAIDAGELEGFFHKAEGIGAKAGDDRAHVLVVFRVAAEVFEARQP